MIILSDIDNTITNMNHVWLDYVNREYGTDYKYEDITDWHFFNRLEEQGINSFTPLTTKRFWADTTVYPNAVRVLEQFVKTGHQVYLITASDVFNPALQFKLAHVLENFNPELINKHNVIVCDHKELVDGDIMFEDNRDILVKWHKYANTEIRKCFCCKQPWNLDNITKWAALNKEDEFNCNESWGKIYDYFFKIKI